MRNNKTDNKKTKTQTEKISKNKQNLIQFSKTEQNDVLTESEINNLFLGFVRLIKKNVVIEKEEKYKKQIQALCDEIMQLQNKIVQLENKN